MHKIASTISKVLCLMALLVSTAQAGDLPEYVKGEVLVRVMDGHQIDWIVRDFYTLNKLPTQLRVKKQVSRHMNIWLLTFDHEMVSHEQLLSAMVGHESIHTAQLNLHIESRVTTPNDPSYGTQWQYEQANDIDLDMADAWDITTGGVTALGDTIVACVIDEGFNINHPDLKDNLWRNYGEIPNNNIDDDGNGFVDDYRGWSVANSNDDVTSGGYHGTPVAGVIGATGNNGVGVAGINWDARVMVIEYGNISTSNVADVLESYDYPLSARKLYDQTNGAKGAFVVVTNASWGINNGQPSAAPLWCQMYDTLGTYGILSCGATANANYDIDATGDLPTACSSDYLIAVTNVDQTGNKVTQAGYGLTTIDLGAFGEDTYTLTTSAYGPFGGTSGATPHVAGAVALMYSAPCPRLAMLAKTQPAQTALLIKRFILNSTVANTSLAGKTVTGGHLNIKSALDSVMAMSCNLSGCGTPFGVATTSVQGTTADLNWYAVDSTTQYYVRYRTVGSSTWSNTTTTDTTVNLLGLTACTSYEVEVAPNCDTTELSSTFTFKTGDCCNAPAILTPSNMTTTSVQYSWATDPFVSYYTVEHKELSASTWTTTTVSTPSIALSNLDTCGEYEIRIISSCPVNVNNKYSDTDTFRTSGCGACVDATYCSLSGSDASDEWISNVQFNTINNASGSDGGYRDFGADGISTTVYQNGSYPISLTLDYSFLYPRWMWRVWIDYDQNGTFDASEIAYTSTHITTNVPLTTGNISIPGAAALGLTRMRVAMNWTNGGNPSSECGSFGYGEVEDYCVFIDAATGIENRTAKANSLQVYPIPFNQQLYTNIQAVEAQDVQVKLVSVAGQTVLNKVVSVQNGNNLVSLDVAHIAAGVYLVQVQLENGKMLTHKVIK
ncbi:MAG: S8 family serine peptidase [Aureispira sp.]|nr:S8 family serine peptidase [Aureispira sp.]